MQVCVSTRSPASLTILGCPAPARCRCTSVEITPWAAGGGLGGAATLRRHRCLGSARICRPSSPSVRLVYCAASVLTSRLVGPSLPRDEGAGAGAARAAAPLRGRRRRCGRRCRASCSSTSSAWMRASQVGSDRLEHGSRASSRQLRTRSPQPLLRIGAGSVSVQALRLGVGALYLEASVPPPQHPSTQRRHLQRNRGTRQVRR